MTTKERKVDIIDDLIDDLKFICDHLGYNELPISRGAWYALRNDHLVPLQRLTAEIRDRYSRPQTP